MQRIAKSIPIEKIEFIDYICPNCGHNLFYSSISDKDDELMKLPSRDEYYKACSKCKTIFYDKFMSHFEVVLEDGRVFNF